MRPIWQSEIKLYALTLTTEILTGFDDLSRLLQPLIERARAASIPTH